MHYFLLNKPGNSFNRLSHTIDTVHNIHKCDSKKLAPIEQVDATHSDTAHLAQQ